MNFRHIIVDNSLQELTQHGDEDFPVSMDQQLVNSEYCAMVKHWHYEVQINLVVKGSLVMRTPAGECLLSEGQGIFINSGCLHEVVPTADTDSVYICVNFHPKFIYGHSTNMIRRDYVDPVLSADSLQAIPLYDLPWHREVCTMMRQLADLHERRPYGYELETKLSLCRIWLLLIQENRRSVECSSHVSFADRLRLRALQQYIHKNYMERVTLSDISKAAHISRGECCRLFRRALQTTPFLYLMHYRIQQSVKLLSMTDLAVSQVAQQTGFGSSSHYAESFKREMKCSPTSYRKQYYQM